MKKLNLMLIAAGMVCTIQAVQAQKTDTTKNRAELKKKIKTDAPGQQATMIQTKGDTTGSSQIPQLVVIAPPQQPEAPAAPDAPAIPVVTDTVKSEIPTVAPPTPATKPIITIKETNPVVISSTGVAYTLTASKNKQVVATNTQATGVNAKKSEAQ